MSRSELRLLTMNEVGKPSRCYGAFAHNGWSGLCLLVFVLAIMATPGCTALSDQYTQTAPAAEKHQLPVFQHKGVVLDYKDLKYNPCNDIIIPSVIRTAPPSSSRPARR